MNFKRYIEASDTWIDSHYIMGTSTDTITTLPAVLYPNATTATVGLKGNMSQTGTPTPTTPIQPSECGDLETDGAKAGQYKIPILNNSQTTNVYLGEVQTTRAIKKLVLDGTESWTLQSINSYGIANLWTVLPKRFRAPQFGLSSHLTIQTTMIADTETEGFYLTSAEVLYIRINATRSSTADELKSYLAQQYANGTPVIVWYILETLETAVVNEPIRKIGDYADEISGISIPVTAGANTISIGTTLQPSEVTVNYKGWHPVQSVHERENGAWT